MSKKKFNRYSIKDMLLNEEKAAGYFPGMYLIYDIPEDEDAATYAERKKERFEAIKNQIMAQVKTITDADALEEPNVPQDQAKKLAPAKSLGSVILGDAFTSEELNNLLSDSPADDKGKVRTAQEKKEDIEKVLGKSATRLPQLQKLFIRLLGETEGPKKFGILLNVIGHPAGPRVESKSTVDGEPKTGPAPEAMMKNGFLDKKGFPNIFFQAFKNVTAADLEKIGQLESFTELQGETATGEFWTAMYNLSGGAQPAVGIGEIYAALRCNGVQGEDSGSGDVASVDVISHVNGQSLNNKKLGAQGATTKAAFCAEVKKLIDDNTIANGWPDFKLLVESFGLHNDSAPSSLSPEDVMARMAECRIGGVEKAKKILGDTYASTFNHPRAAIVAQEGMAYIFHQATTNEINAKSTKGKGSGKTPFTSWQDGNTFTEIREATGENVCLPVAGIGSGRVLYNRGGYFKLLPDKETTSKAWLEKVDLEKFSEAAENPSDVKYDSSTFPEFDIPQTRGTKLTTNDYSFEQVQQFRTNGFTLPNHSFTYRLIPNKAELIAWSKKCYDAKSLKALSGEYKANPFVGYDVLKVNKEDGKTETITDAAAKVDLFKTIATASTARAKNVRGVVAQIPYKIAKARRALVILGANAEVNGKITDEQIAIFLSGLNGKKTITAGAYNAWLYTPGLDTTEVPSFAATANEALAVGKIYKKSLLEILDLIP